MGWSLGGSARAQFGAGGELQASLNGVSVTVHLGVGVGLKASFTLGLGIATLWTKTAGHPTGSIDIPDRRYRFMEIEGGKEIGFIQEKNRMFVEGDSKNALTEEELEKAVIRT